MGFLELPKEKQIDIVKDYIRLNFVQAKSINKIWHAGALRHELDSHLNSSKTMSNSEYISLMNGCGFKPYGRYGNKDVESCYFMISNKSPALKHESRLFYWDYMSKEFKKR